MMTEAPRRKVRLFTPPLHPGQLEVARDTTRFRVLACGRRWGKSQLALMETLRRTARPNSRTWYVAPTYPMVGHHWRTFRSMLGNLPKGVAEFHAQDHRITLVNGAEVQFLSGSDPDKLRGAGLDLVIVDEAAFIPDGGRLWDEVLRPALTDRRGRGLFISTPNGFNHFSEWYHRGLGSDEAWHSFHFPTATNPHLPAEDVADAQRTLPERVYRQEYLAEFIEDGSVFRGVRDCIARPAPAPRPGARIVFGVDWAKSEDYTVVVALDAETLEVVGLDRFNRVDYSLQRQRISLLAERLSPTVILVESNSIGDPMLEELRRAGLPVRGFATTAQSKPPLIDALSLAIEQRRLRLPDDPILLAELQAYTVTQTRAGNWQYGAPSGLHDDCVMALAIALKAATVPIQIAGWA